MRNWRHDNAHGRYRDKTMKGKDISVDEAGEDKIEAFADQENEAETLDDERAQLATHAKERMKRKELEVFIGGLDRDAVEEDLKRVFRHVGEVIDIRMHREVSTNKNKGYAFVKFATKEQASRALSEMRNSVVRFSCVKHASFATTTESMLLPTVMFSVSLLGLHVALMMFTGYLVGYYAFRALFSHSPAMSAAGGILGLVGGMLVETLLFIIRTSSQDRKPTRKSTSFTSKQKKNQ
ncbi:PREDICTED: RNA-binding protein Musashi homolog 1-like [Nicotiana attenuata]|uniref:RNA-binding protein Musashi homolog 1-like n=1 Tax=Nicotiana attenuata TaxID=49451 RepID=UPI0009054490|nr:PREDICTED: RNA-binding protein Musashi homolog 1-like [Nicotiana attenuata]